eukprot:UN34041
MQLCNFMYKKKFHDVDHPLLTKILSHLLPYEIFHDENSRILNDFDKKYLINNSLGPPCSPLPRDAHQIEMELQSKLYAWQKCNPSNQIMNFFSPLRSYGSRSDSVGRRISDSNILSHIDPNAVQSSAAFQPQ